MKLKHITYEQIAKVANKSLATISRVLNRSPHVTEETRLEVIEAMRSLGMEVNAHDLIPEREENLIIFNVPTLKNPFYSPIASSARATASAKGYSLLVNEDPITPASIETLLQITKKTKAAGLLCANSLSKEHLHLLSQQIPLVICCESGLDTQVPFVTIDDETAAFNVMHHILSLGKRRVALINGPSYFKYARARYRGYEEGLKTVGLTVDRSLIAEMEADMDFDQAKASCIHMLNSSTPPDAFFCISDVLAAAAVKATLEMGYRVPQDVVVVGFDDVPISSIMNPTITTIRQPTAQIGALAVEMLIKQINGEQMEGNSIYLSTELIIRESSSVR